MSYSVPKIEIHLITDLKNKDLDHKITITKNLNYNDFDVAYSEPGCVNHKMTGFYRTRVINYLYMIFKNQSLDEQGYTNIQFGLPGMPCVIISGDKMKDLYYREHFLELVGTALDTLENCNVPKSENDYTFSDDDYKYSYSYDTPTRSTKPGVLPQHLVWD